jgi:hypothetical protein
VTKDSGYRMKLLVKLCDAKEKSLYDYATTGRTRALLFGLEVFTSVP